MPRTPEKKRPGHLLASPESGISAATKKQGTEVEKRKKRYHFAPINNLAGRNKDDSGVLRSISVSQVRNSKMTNASRQIKKTSNSKSSSTSPVRATNDLKEAKRVAASIKEVKASRGDDVPSEEVIWRYSPTKGELSDRIGSSHHNSEDWIEFDRGQDPSSTPVVPKMLKNVLSFANISEPEQTEQKESLSAQIRNSTRSRGTTESLKESLRDIDDILDDMEGDLALKPKIPKINELPSSPSRIQEQGEREVGKAEETHTPSDVSSSDGDDSLIDLLTQQGSKKLDVTRMSVDIDTLDDSLLEYLDNTGEKAPEEEVEMEIENVEAMLSQNLKMAKCETPELEEYIQLASFPYRRKGVARLVLTKITEISLPKIGRQKILSCIDQDGKEGSVVVRKPWVYLEFEKGDVIHIIEGANFENKRLVSDDKNPVTQLVNDNLLILNPDLLLSATAVGGSIECLRRAVLQQLLEDSQGEPSIVMTIGNIVHELLQSALRYKLNHKTITIKFLEEKLDCLLELFSFGILQCNEDLNKIKDEIKTTHLKNIFDFVDQFVKKSNYGCYVSVSGTRKTDPLSIASIIDTEENIWSPIYGLKGFLDVTVDALCKKTRSVVPLEVKTGKSKSISHEAQGLIYTLLLNDRYEIPIDFYLLLYTRKNEITKYPYVLHSIKHVLMFRNQMTTKLKYRLKEYRNLDPMKQNLPPLLQSSYCDSCNFKAPCMVINNLVEDGDGESSGLKNGEYELLTKHLATSHSKNAQFFKKYNDLITKEESSITCINKKLFHSQGESQDSVGSHCLSNLKVVETVNDLADNTIYLHTLARAKPSGMCASMLNSHLMKKDRVFISDEAGHFGIANGHIRDIAEDFIIVSTRRKVLNNWVPPERSNGPPYIRSVVDDSITADSLMRTQNMVTYRINKNDIQQGLSLARFSLLNLFLPPVPPGQMIADEASGQVRLAKKSEGGDERLRSILVDKVAARFESKCVSSLERCGEIIPTHLNTDQKRAIEKVLQARDFALILGMPGTGKTTVIAELIKILASAGKSILLTSYTHSAVDNILLKLKDTNIKIARLGMKHRIHPDTQIYRPCYESLKTYEDYIKEIEGTTVVATTCLGIREINSSLRSKDFDYVILDEASQISMPVALAPLRFGEKFVMVGDHYQLPPLVKNEAARIGGLEESLFKILCDDHPESVSELTIQYRMCEDIATLSNFLIYDGKLKCGTADVRDRGLDVPHLSRLAEFQTSPTIQRWIEDVLDFQRKVVFLNYDSCSDIQEKCSNTSITNPGELTVVQQCIDGMLECGVQAKNVGVMTLYRAQLRLLKEKLQDERHKDLEILTADQFQGRDKDCIVISLVRSNLEQKSGSLLKELRRVNVAMTRAKSKLILIGSRKTISSVPEIEKFIALLQDRGWIYELSANFLQAYVFPSTSKVQASCDKKLSGNTKFKVKSIDANSKLLRNKPITRQAVSEL